jgi:hypothetical protein
MEAAFGELLRCGGLIFGPDSERTDALRAALNHLQTPPMVFLPYEVTKAAESVGSDAADRALRQR